MCVLGFNPHYVIHPCFKRIGVKREGFEQRFTGKNHKKKKSLREGFEPAFTGKNNLSTEEKGV